MTIRLRIFWGVYFGLFFILMVFSSAYTLPESRHEIYEVIAVLYVLFSTYLINYIYYIHLLDKGFEK